MRMIKVGSLFLLLTVTGIKLEAQFCTNSLDSVYGLNSITGSGSGQIVRINVNNAGSVSVGSPATTSDNANGLGFSSINARFYFFNETGNGITQFVSFNPISGSKVVLAAPPVTLTTAQKVRSGTVDSAGGRYYTINPNAAVPYFYYYNIGANTWTTITSTFKDKSGNTITDFKNLNSGDMTFDGQGNLWVLCSNSTQYALYKIKAPVPTIVTASLLADTIISIRANPVSGVSFTGIAFNSSGKLYFSTGSGVGAGNNKLYSLATPTSPLVLVGTLTNGIGDDLSSCTYPVAVLTTSWINFSATLQNNAVRLSWTVNESENVTGYDVEFSKDGEHWQTISRVAKDNFTFGNIKVYSYNHEGYTTGNNYYRIVQLTTAGRESMSSTKMVNTNPRNKVYIGPNPAKDVIYLYNKSNSSKLMAQIFDKNGQLVWSTVIAPDQQSINISQLPRGSFVLRLSSPLSNENSGGYQFIKW